MCFKFLTHIQVLLFSLTNFVKIEMYQNILCHLALRKSK